MTGAAGAAAGQLLRMLCLAGILGFPLIPFAAQAAEDEDEPPLAPPEAGTPASGAGGRKEEAALPNWLTQAGITGSLRAGYWSSNRRLDDETNIGVASTWLKLDKKLDSGLGLFAEGYLANEDIFGDQRDTSRLREAYVDARSDAWDFRFGRQIVAWGRADRLNPTDNLTPRDFTLLVPEVDEDRFGSLAAKATWNLNTTTGLTGIWLPDFQPNVVGLPPAPGVVYQENIPTGSRQWALKLDQSGGRIDWSVSYFDGYDLNPDLSFGASSSSINVVTLDHHRIKVLGADAATTVGAYRYAVEAAYTRTEDSDGTNPFVRNPFVYAVFGVERDFGNNLDVIVQAFAREILNYSNPEAITDPATRSLAVQQAVAGNQYDSHQQGISVRIGKKWFNETVEGELAGAFLLNRSGYLLRPKLSWAASDNLKLITGVEYFGGSDKTSYGVLEKNNGVFAEARYFF